jgi:hypothetical protein
VTSRDQRPIVFRQRTLNLFLTLSLAALLAGCGAGPVSTSPISTAVQFSGKVHGGQQGVSGSTIQLYAAGNTGNGSAATPLIPSNQAVYSLGGGNGCNAATQSCYSSVLSDANGNFTISGDYSCPSTNPIVYLVATGGNPGIAGFSSNPALVMMAPLGPCTSLSAIPFTEINELSTVASAWAMAPFMNGYANVGSSATNGNGLANAVANAALLANANSGSFPSNLKAEGQKLDALANILAACVNSDGTTGCTPLFSAATPSGGTAPTNVLNAALNIVKNPGYNVSAVFQVGSALIPFLPTLTAAPHDWTMSLTITGGGLFMPNGLGVDAQSNVWVAGQIGPMSEFNAQGTPITGAYGYPACYTSTSGTTYCQGLEQATGLAIDSVGNIWVPNYNSPYDGPGSGSGSGSVTAFYGTNSGKTGAVMENIYYANVPTMFDGTLSYPDGISTNTNGEIFIANNGDSSATIWNLSGGLLYGDSGANLGLNSYPQSIAADSNGGFWMPDSNYAVAHIQPNSTTGGTLISNTSCCYASYGVATDAYGNAWVTNHLNNSFSEINDQNLPPNVTTGTVVINQSTVGGVASPGYLAIDAKQNVWIANGNNTISEIAGNAGTLKYGTTATLSAGSAISPSSGFGLDASLSTPYSIIPDESGNIWISNTSVSAITMFYGLATPTLTPTQPVPTAP